MKTKKVIALLVLLLGLGLILASCDDVLGLGSEIEEGSGVDQENENDSTDTGTETGNGEESTNDDSTDPGTETGNGENPTQDDNTEYQLKDLSDLEYRDMVEVPGGRFLQQSSSHDGLDHTISSFEIGKYLVTYELWYTVRVWAEDNGYEFANPGREGSVGPTGGEPTAQGKHEPVTDVNWRDSIVWLNAYSEMEGSTPVYYADSARTVPIRDSNAPETVLTEPGSIDNPHVNWGADGYRLPTEGEWQYAASFQDGTNWTPFNYASGATADYNNTTATGEVAWYAENSGDKTQTVGTKLPNQLEIHDMSGNVWEWTWDWRTDYPAGPETDYRGPGNGDYRVIRGGCYFDYVMHFLTIGFRNYRSPWSPVDQKDGFRPARSVDAGEDGTFIITFDSQGGTSVETQTVESGGTVVEPTAPEWDGEGDRPFIGWSDAAEGGTLWDFNTPVTGDITLYAQWFTGEIGTMGPAGGLIFYVDDDEHPWTYYEVAPQSTEWVDKEWGDYGTEIGGDAQLTGIGDGRAATDAIVQHLTDNTSETDRAAQLCDALVHEGYDDWFLPSKDELNAIWENLVDDGSGNNSGIGGFASGFYWSSSEGNSLGARRLYFNSGYQDNLSKFFNGRVRAVRAF